MTYVCAAAENMPFPDGYFDVVSSFNSLDHVDDLESTLMEIVRVLKPDGLFLLLTEVNHEPRPTEPIRLSWNVVDSLAPPMVVLKESHYEKVEQGLYESVRQNIPYDHHNNYPRPGILSVMCMKKTAEKQVRDLGSR